MDPGAVLVFLGTHINKVDKKGRVSVPASFRSQLAKIKAAEIALFPSYNVKAIEGCGPDSIQALATASPYNIYTADAVNLTGDVFERTHLLEWDSEGRIVLPEALIVHAGISEQAVFVGRGRMFQLWSPEALATQRAADAAKMAQNPPRLVLRAPEDS